MLKATEVPVFVLVDHQPEINGYMEAFVKERYPGARVFSAQDAPGGIAAIDEAVQVAAAEHRQVLAFLASVTPLRQGDDLAAHCYKNEVDVVVRCSGSADERQRIEEEDPFVSLVIDRPTGPWGDMFDKFDNLLRKGRSNG